VEKTPTNPQPPEARNNRIVKFVVGLYGPDPVLRQKEIFWISVIRSPFIKGRYPIIRPRWPRQAIYATDIK